MHRKQQQSAATAAATSLTTSQSIKKHIVRDNEYAIAGSVCLTNNANGLS